MIILLSSLQPSEWLSCQRISANLEALYQSGLEEKLAFKCFSRRMSEMELWQLAEEILLLSPTEIVFIDHQPHPCNLLPLLLTRLPETTVLTFHAYGDFILPHPEAWLKIEPLLKKYPVRFISASKAQKRLMELFTRAGSTHEQLAFPVDTNKFRFLPDKREGWRQRLALGDSFTWLYTGRLSLQKNILPLVELFCDWKKHSGTNDKLILKGNFDKVGFPYLGIYHQDNEFYWEFRQFLRRFPETITQDIIYDGPGNESQIVEAYAGADAFISLSTHHDEDFGMAPAEALATGLPALLSRWGGYRSFADGVLPVKLVETSFHKGHLTFSKAECLRKMNMIRHLESHRDGYRDNFEKAFGKNVLGERLNEIRRRHPVKFPGFSNHFSELCQRWMSGPHTFSSDFKQLNFFYEKTYATYYR